MNIVPVVEIRGETGKENQYRHKHNFASNKKD